MKDFQAAKAKFDEIKQLKSTLVLENNKVRISILLSDTQFFSFPTWRFILQKTNIIFLEFI